MIRYLSLFSGIGGFEYGMEQSRYADELECVGFSEIDKYATEIYRKHYPEHKALGDVTEIETSDLPDFDLLVGGFPCQAFSIAGLRRGFDDTRGTLFFEIARILRDKKPRNFLLENVKGLLSHDHGKTFKTILRVLSEMGYDVQWEVYNSKDHGVPQNRERIYLKGHLRGECGDKIFLVRGSGTAPAPKMSNEWYGTRTGKVHQPDGQLGTLTATGQCSGGAQLIQLNKGMKKPQDQRVYDSEGLSITLNASGNNGFYKVHEEKESPGIMRVGNISPTGHHSKQVLSTEGISRTLCASASKGGIYIDDEKPDKSHEYRRLTPRECEKLQGFPVDWTSEGANGDKISDTQRYKCCGNAVTTNVVRDIFNTWEL